MVNFHRLVGCDCTPGAVMVQGLGHDPDLAVRMRMYQSDVVFEHQFFVFAQNPPAAGLTVPVGAFRFDMKIGLQQKPDPGLSHVFQSWTRYQQFDRVVFVSEAGRKVSQGVIEAGIGHGDRRWRGPVAGHEPANAKGQQQGHAGRQDNFPVHSKILCQSASLWCPARISSQISRTAPWPPACEQT